MTETRKRPKHARPSRRVRKELILKPVSLRMADDEMEIVRAAAAEQGVTVSGYMRAAALGTASMPPAQQQKLIAESGAIIN